jgi:3-oxoacyl-[acyl-carrier protein] reductase
VHFVHNILKMKVAIVTGASSGIGRSIALKLAELNHTMVLTGRNEKKLINLKRTIEDKGLKCLTIIADLEKECVPKKIIDQTITCFGQIDLLVNNAGMAYAASISETDGKKWDKIFFVNVRAPFLLCKEVISVIKVSKNPIIINIGSVVGFKGYAGQAAYAASKHALNGFTKVLAKEVQHYGIQVHLISPGGVNTEMAAVMRPDIDKVKLIEPEEIAELVGFLVSRKGKGTIDQIYLRRKNGLAFD